MSDFNAKIDRNNAGLEHIMYPYIEINELQHGELFVEFRDAHGLIIEDLFPHRNTATFFLQMIGRQTRSIISWLTKYGGDLF